MPPVSRRSFLRSAGLAALTGVAGAPARAAPRKGRRYVFFTPVEAAFIEAAVARLIPADELGPGALEADVPAFIDQQLAGAWGGGERLYRSGPWKPGTASQGYQLPFTPAELFRNALRGIAADLKAGGRGFASLPAGQQDAYLRRLEKGGKDLGGVPSQVFFESLLEMSIEGYFSDPVYGGNRGMAAWEMIGFPGAYANYYELVDHHGIAFVRKPLSLGENGSGHLHPEPGIPAYAPARSK